MALTVKKCEYRIENSQAKHFRRVGLQAADGPKPLCLNEIVNCTISVQLRPLFCAECIYRSGNLTAGGRGDSSGAGDELCAAGCEPANWEHAVRLQPSRTPIRNRAYLCSMRARLHLQVFCGTLLYREHQPLRLLPLVAHATADEFRARAARCAGWHFTSPRNVPTAVSACLGASR